MKEKAYSPKISISGQNVFEILAQLCFDDSMQILPNLTQFITLGLNQVKFRRICMESSEQNGASIETICPTMLVFGNYCRTFRCCSFTISQKISKNLIFMMSPL